MENKTQSPAASASAAPEQKSQGQPAASPTPTSAEQKPAEQKPEVEPAEKSTTTPPPAAGAASPKRSASGILLLVLVAAVVFGSGGFVLGQGTSRSSDKSKQEGPTPTAVQGKKDVTTTITGKAKTDAHGLDYFIVDLSEYGPVKAKDHQTRYVLNPQVNTEYTYSFDKLMPNASYTVTMQGCAEKDQKSTCVLSKKIVICSGRIPGGAVQQCLINGDGQADFFLDKILVNDIVSPSLTPTPTVEPQAVTSTP